MTQQLRTSAWCACTFPRGIYSLEQLDAIADEINDRPRKGLGVRSPLAVYRELLINNP